MRTINKLFLLLVTVLTLSYSSCSDDYGQWDLDSDSERGTWVLELHNIVSDFNFIFENSSVKFLEAKEMSRTVDTSDFINEETSYPVCIRNLYNFFLLRSLDFVLNDTTSIHMPSANIKDMVSSIVENQDKYDFIRLTWLYCNKKFETVAVFDKLNGEIVYDNILTNIPLSQMELPSRKTKLTRAEGGGGELETRIFYKDKLTVDYLGYYFDYRIKGLCKVTCNSSGVCSLLCYETILDQLTHSPYEEGMFYPVANVVIYGGNIYYYLWVGIGTDDFALHYNSVIPGENAYNLWVDKHEKHILNNAKCEVERAGFYYNLNSGLYTPDLGWNF